MQILEPNNVRIYNLSSGKSIPEWLSNRKKRLLLKKNVDLRKRIELIQDFEMPGVSTSIRLSPNGHYVMATGVYKPRVRCYDVFNFGMKFERCFDSEVVTFEILSEDYSKAVFLHSDRFIEIHSAEGKYYRLRIPKFGHDLKYHNHTCDLYVVGASPDIYRLNLEKGQYQPLFTSKQTNEINKVIINQVHGLIITGGREGKVEAWDPRTGSCIATLDCALSCLLDSKNVDELPSVTSLNFSSNLTYGVGMSTGQILLYDIRTNKPFRLKDHLNEFPIKNVEFIGEHVLSMDESIVKIWNKETGNLFTSINAGSYTQFNDLCVVPNSGMLFIANENVKIQTYYIPNLGPAPRWCGFLDALTEELEESSKETVYDDYKFVTEKQLEELGLTHLIGSDLLRAYMHGFFMDVRLYKKAKSAAEPFDYERYKKKKIQETLDSEKINRVQIRKALPTVNKLLALKLIEGKTKKRKSSKEAEQLLTDERFKSLFENPEFEVDTNCEEYKFLSTVIKRFDEKHTDVQQLVSKQFENEIDMKSSSETSGDESDESSTDEDNTNLNEQNRPSKISCIKNVSDSRNPSKTIRKSSKRVKVYEIRPNQESAILSKETFDNLEIEQKLLSERVKQCEDSLKVLPYGNREFSYISSKNSKSHQKEKIKMENHQKERKQLIRLPPKYKKKKF